MRSFRSDFLGVVAERGYLQDCSDLDGLDRLLCEGPLTAYIGFDCTADSLHVGHLIGIMLLRWFQATGHRPIALMGGGTTKVGDPSGKDESRKLLSEAEINANLAGIRRVFDRYLAFAPAEDGGGPTDALMINNADWLDHLNYIAFLRDYGRHFSVNRMLAFDSVKLRLEREQPLSFLEFNYMILQAYDFLELYRRTGCRLQMGGSDQWGNILNGVELGRRTDGAELFALTAPLLTTASGQKMGKTAAGAVWLNPDRLAPYDFWQFWRNAEDGDVGRFLRLFTDLPMAEIARLEALGGAEINAAKVILANAATAMAHGGDAAAAAEATARTTFAEGGIGADLPTITLPRGDLERGLPAFDLFQRAGLCASRGEARRLIQQGGARVNDGEVTSELQSIGLADLGATGAIKLSAGKKRHALVRPD